MIITVEIKWGGYGRYMQAELPDAAGDKEISAKAKSMALILAEVVAKDKEILGGE